jgi:hypothetical protein
VVGISRYTDRPYYWAQSVNVTHPSYFSSELHQKHKYTVCKKYQIWCNAKDSSTCSQRWTLKGWSTGCVFPTNTDVNMYRWCTFMVTLITYNIHHIHSYDCLPEQLSRSEQVVEKPEVQPGTYVSQYNLIYKRTIRHHCSWHSRKIINTCTRDSSVMKVL